MKINLKARLQNKTFILSAIALVVSFIYKILSLFEVVPSVGESELLEMVGVGVNILAFFGVVIDPTTEGVNDSPRALSYFTDDDERFTEGINIE